MALLVEHDNSQVTRSLAGWDATTGQVSAFGTVPTGSRVSLAIGERGGARGGVAAVMDRLKSMTNPRAALVVSCAGRKWLLGEEFAGERAQISSALGQDLPLIAFPSLGEFGSVMPGDDVCPFHNVTCVVTLIGP